MNALRVFVQRGQAKRKVVVTEGPMDSLKIGDEVYISGEPWRVYKIQKTEAFVVGKAS